MKSIRMLATAAAAAALLLGAGSQAIAAPDRAGSAPTEQTTAVPRIEHVKVGAGAEFGALATWVDCIEPGNAGDIRLNTYYTKDWNGDGWDDECFGIADDYSIWHAWRGSDGWWEMPGEGNADDIHTAWTQGQDRVVQVRYDEPRPKLPTYWCSRKAPNVPWNQWHRCTKR